MEPNDLPELARIYVDDQEPQELRDRALASLLRAYCVEQEAGPRSGEAGQLLAAVLGPVVRSVARNVARNAARHKRDDFIEGALALALAWRSAESPPRICKFRPGQGPLRTWLYTTLYRCWVSERRRDRRWQPVPEAVAEVAVSPGDRNWTEVLLDLIAPFSAADLARIREWGARERVEVLCLAGLWFKVLPQLREEWLAEYQVAREVVLPRPFPPAWFLLLDNPKERTAPLAQLLGYPRPNTLSQRWLRGQRPLKGLDFVREASET